MGKKPNKLLTDARVARRWSQEDVATQIGVHVGQVRAWERGAELPPLSIRHKLCTLFRMDMDALGLVKQKTPRQLEREAFLREKRANITQTDKTLEATGKSHGVMNVRKRKGGRARKVRRGS